MSKVLNKVNAVAFLGFFLVLVFLATYFLSGNAFLKLLDDGSKTNESNFTIEPINHMRNIEIKNAFSSMPPHKSTPAANMETEEKISKDTKRPPQDAAFISAWFAKHSVPANSEYDSYDTDTLKQLALNGDEIATHKLILRYARDKSVNYAIQFAWDTAVNGSIAALNDLRLLLESRIYPNAKGLEEKHKIAIEVLALGEVSAMRGNPIYKHLIAPSSIVVFDRDGVIITKSDGAIIKTRSQEIYDDLQKKRNELGLGAFDNSMPDSVKKEFDELEKYNYAY